MDRDAFTMLLLVMIDFTCGACISASVYFCLLKHVRRMSLHDDITAQWGEGGG